MQAPSHLAVPPQRFAPSWITVFARRFGLRGGAPARRGAGYALIAWVFAYPTCAPGQELWRGLEVGASLKSVRQAFPDATQPLSVTTLADGETDDLTTHALSLGDRLVEARFFFRDGGLTSVQLVPVARRADPAATLQMAKRFSALLSERYGSPFDCGDNSYAGVGLYRCKWLSGPIIIRLWYLDAAGESPSLRVAFRKADDAAYDF